MKKPLKYFLYSVASIVVVIILFFLSMCGVYLYEHHERVKSEIDNNKYKVKLLHFPSGFGTTPYIKIKLYDKSKDKETLLLYYDAKDTADLKFIDSNTLQVNLLRHDYSSYGNSYWYTTDSFIFILNQDIEPIIYKWE